MATVPSEPVDKTCDDCLHPVSAHDPDAGGCLHREAAKGVEGLCQCKAYGWGPLVGPNRQPPLFGPGDVVDYRDCLEPNPDTYRGEIIGRVGDGGSRWHVQLDNGGEESALPSELTLVRKAGQPEPPADLSGGGILLSPPRCEHERFGTGPHCLTIGCANNASDIPEARFGDRVAKPQQFDVVEKAEHYNRHPSGIEAIEVVRHMGFNTGNAVKYVWRADLKGNALEDLKKARYYINDEIAKRERQAASEG